MSMFNPFSKASRVLRKHRKRPLQIPGVHGLAVMRATQFGGDNIPCLVVYGSPTTNRSAVPTELDGIPLYLIH